MKQCQERGHNFLARNVTGNKYYNLAKRKKKNGDWAKNEQPTFCTVSQNKTEKLQSQVMYRREQRSRKQRKNQ